MTVKNGYTLRPADVKPGDELLFVIKAIVMHDGTFRVYRCPWSTMEFDVPQGDPVISDSITHGIFPVLEWAKLKLDIG